MIQNREELSEEQCEFAECISLLSIWFTAVKLHPVQKKCVIQNREELGEEQCEFAECCR